MLEVTPQFGEEAVDTQTGRPVWWDGYGWSYAKPGANSGGHAGKNGRPSLPTLIRQERPALLPLSYAQQRLWFLDKLNGASTEYNIVDGLLLRGELDLQLLQRAVNAIVERHEVLRTYFAEVEGQPVQIIDPKLEIILSLEDVSALGETSRLERLTAAMQWEREQRFELSRGPLFRLRLFRLSNQEHMLLRVAHHIIWDGWSQGIFEREFAVLYGAFQEGRENPLAPLPVQYADFVLWQRAVLDEETVARYLEYWRAQLSGIPEQLNLPLDRPRGTHRIVAGGMVRNALPDELAIAMRQLSYDNHATLYMSLLAAFAVLLNRYSGQDDILVASPIANRHDTQLEQLIGYFVNALVMRTRVNPRTSFRKLLADVRVTALEAFRHQDVPFEQLRDDLSPERSLSTAPIFQVMFALQNLPVNSHRHGRLEIVPVRLGNFQSRFDLEVYATERESGIEFSWVFNCGLFDQWRIEQMSQNYQRLLQAVLASPDVPLHQLHILTPAERVQLLEQGNGVPQERTPQKLVHQMFQDQVERTPDMIAVECEGVSLSYAELDRRANQLAHYLQGLGVAAEHRVGICMERGLDMMVSLLGVLKAGGAYVPFDPAYPDERLVYMAQDSGVAVLLTQAGLQDRLHNSATRILDIDGNWAKIAEQSDRTPHLQIDPAQLAYVIYTSGSTGKPKGVCVEHRQVCNQLIWAGQALQLTSAARVLQKASFSFDASILEIFLPLAWGARVVVARPGGELDADYLVRLATEREVTYVDLVPSLLENILSHPLIRHWTSLRVMSSGAEVLKPQLVKAFYQSLPAAVLWNTYGPTEATVQSTFAVCVDTSGAAPIGKPIANTQTYVLDPWLEPTPVGVPGELYIGGAGVARGYWNRPELTAEKFMPNPFAVQPGERLYRTGDLVTWRQDGNLDFVGRVDHQIKIRGYRIELGEIEAVLRGHERVQDALIAVREQSGQKQLLAYVVALPDEAERLQEQASRIEQWRRVYDSTYWQGGASSGDFNTEGWNSSYTGAAIPREEMRTWIEETVKAIRALEPAQVLEIGCGTGLLLTRLAPDCDSYVGLDFSGPTLTQLGDYLSQRPDLSHVILRQGLAHELSFLKDDCVDLVILNSVVQYFPNMDYLLQVLAEAVRVTKRGGHIFVGDIRSLPLLDAYHTSVQLYKAAEHTSLDDLRQRVSRARENEEELVLDPGLFSELGRRWGKIGRVSVALKSGRYDNELSRFRYDVTLRLGKKEKVAAPGRWLSWSEADHWQQELKHALEQGKELSLGVRGIPDLRVAPPVRATRLLRSPGEGVSKAGEVVQACARERGADPHMLMELARGLGVELCWQRFSADGVYDAIFNPQWQEQPGIAEPQRSFYRRFGNIPMQREASGKLGRSLQSWLRQSLPDFMLPAAVMVVPAWPLTPSGKIDRQALPTPERHSDSYRAPRGPLEEMLCEIFAEVLSLERVGIDDNFFACGGHSLLAMRLASRVRAIMGMELPIRALFQTPTIAELVPQLAAEDRKTQMPVIAPERPPLLPLSHAQQRLWFINKLQGASPEYNILEALHLRGELNRGALHQAINAIVARHESLRTHFVEVDDDPVQIIEPDLRIDLPMQDLTGLDELKRQEELKTAFRKEGEQAFDLACGPLLRMKLIKLSEHEHVLMRSFHHIISDGWSHGVFTRELMVLYDAFQEGRENPLPPLPVQYPDYALWQRTALDEEAVGPELEYWKQKLSGIPDYLDLPKDRPRPPNQTFAGELCQMTLSAETVAAVKSLGQASQTTLYMTLVSVFAVLLHRYSGQKDIVVGSPIANRQDARLEQLIGLFVNSLVLRMQITPQETFREFLGAVRQTALEAYLHQEVPFERLVEVLSPQRSLNITPIFQVLFALQNAPMGSQRLRKLVIEPLARDTHIVRLDLEVHAFEREGNIAFYWFYKRELFDRWRVEQMARNYQRLLQALVAAPDIRIAALEMLDETEKQQLLFEWNRTESAYSQKKPVHRLIEEQVAATPDSVALFLDQQQWTYTELNERANQLAHHLRNSGTGPESRVAILMERSFDMVVALLAVWKAGGAYVPLDPAYPAERLGYMLEDAQVAVLVTHRNLHQAVSTYSGDVIKLDEEWKTIKEEKKENLSSSSASGNLAYVIYTSGSTGKPKGTMVTHEALTNFLVSVSREPGIKADDVLLAITTLSFDIAALEIYLPLITGACLVLATREETMDGVLLARKLAEHGVTMMQATPATWRLLLGAEWEGNKTLKVLCGGEALTPDLAAQLREKCGALWNMYGPTETTVWSTAHPVTETTGSVPIGRPLANTQLYVLDGELNPVPMGVVGELYIGGHGVARGYLNRPDLTAQRFIPDPFGRTAGARLYYTGDLVRYRKDGVLEFLGRNDYQVKIRGFRIELGEIEAALRHCEAVQDALVMVREDVGGEKQLVSYVVPAAGKRADAAALRDAIGKSLPAYMVPSVVMVVPSWPLTPSGKIDRRALPVPERQMQGYRGPRGPQEEMLCEIFAEVLSLERVGIDDDFFALGGHSLLVPRLVGRVRAVTGMELPIRSVFESPTVCQLAPHLARESVAARMALVTQERPVHVPVSHAQRRLWFINQLEGSSAEYNLSEALRLQGELDVASLERAINTIVVRHEILRTTFKEINGEPVQLICPEVQINLLVEDLSALEQVAQQKRVVATQAHEAEQPFDLASGPLLRTKLFKLSDNEHILLRSFHHIVFDGWSRGIFITELKVLYEAFHEGRENPLPPLPLQYADFALWQLAVLNDSAIADDMEYWKKTLAGIPGHLELPQDRPRPPQQTFAADRHQIVLAAQAVPSLKRLAQASQATLYMTLVSVFALLLQRYSGQNDIVIGSPIANRQAPELEHLIGLFVNSLVMRVRIRQQQTFRDFLKAVRLSALHAYAHQEIPFEQLVQELSPQRSLNVTPIFQVLFALQNAPAVSQGLKDLKIELVASDTQTVRTDLEVDAFEREGQIAFYWLYKRELFDRWRVEQMARHYIRLLEAVLADPDQPVSHLDLLSDGEKHQVLHEWNKTEALPDRWQTISQLFEAQARRTPGAVALAFQARQLTYAELDCRANQVGQYLRKIGVGSEVRVGACIERGPEMIVALLGILKSGGTYVPLDPDFPAERLAYMIQDTATRVVLTQTKFRSLLPAGIRLLDLEAECDNIAAESAEPPIPLAVPLNAAYIIYTSGSTGQPKGVVIEHRNVHNMVLAQHAAFAVQETDRVLQFFSFSFDVSIFATFMALGSGAKLLLGTADQLMPGPGLLSLLETEEVTIGVLPPIVLDHLPETRLPRLRQVIVGGEPWSEELLKTWGKGRRFFNSYGPTETTVQAAVGECRVGEGKPSIGRPILNARIYLLDEEGQPVPVGVAGELYITGEGVGRGYLDNSITAEKYLPDPFRSNPGSRMYRTGDWARWLPDGRIDLLGRKDEQVKIRGYRVELGEIESVLGQHPSVLQCAVVARQAEHRERRLVAYVVPSQPSARGGELRAYLKNKLPEYMVPSKFMMMEQLPLNSSGKVDRNALPEVEFGSADIGRPPRTPEEEILCQIFAEVLGLPHVSIDDNFFDLGGHSLMATRLSSRLRSVLAVELPLHAIFESPTVAGLGPHLRQGGKTRADLVAQARPERLPMSYAQQRLWFLGQLEGKSTEYHIPEALRLRGSLDYQALYRAVAAIVQRHEILRTCFSQAADGQPVQIVKAHAAIDLPVEDLTGLSEDLQRQSVAAARRYECEHPFDLAHGPLLRMKLLKLGECEHILLRTFHHIITDGWSQGIFNRELAALYQAFHEDQPDPVEPLSIQYADFALWQRHWLDEALKDQLRYWKEQLSGIPEELALPKDCPRPPRQTFAASACCASLTTAQVAALKQLCQSNQTTLYMTLLSALAVLLQRYSRQDDIVLGSPIANRQEEQLENLMGFFVNSLVLRVRVNPEQSFYELLAQVRAMALEAYRHQDLPFERLVEELSPQRSLNRTPIYQVLFLWQNAPMESPRFMDLEVAYLPSQDLQTHFDLELQAMEKDGTIQFHWLYNRDLFDAWRIQQMAGNYLRLLQAVVATPELRLGALEILDETEKQQLLIEWNRTESAYPQGKPVHRLVEEQVAATPNSVALILGQQRWTYAELNERANQLARYLKNSGIGPESRVAVLIERSSEMIVALLAVWKAGGAYVPLDPAYPAERLGYMLEDGQVAVLLTHRNLHQAVSTYSGNVIRLDEEWTAIKGEKKENLCSSSIPGNLAYVIYTSGSTGKPKGTMVTHEALTNFLVSVSREPGINPDDVLLAVTTLSFDIAALEIYLPLITGACLVLATREEAMDGVLLARKLVEHGVTMMQATPATWRLLFATEWEGNKTLKVLCGGEALTPDLAAQLREKCGALWNMYGPTETTVWSAIHQVTETTSSVPLGRPLSNTQLYVLDEGMNPVPRGVAGELYIGGHGIARGYLNRPDLSAHRFVPDPFGKTAGARLYYTGDVVRYRRDGALEFLGRSDYQVKIRGFRIELAEIETVLQEFPDVEQAVVIARTDEGADKQLAAYVVCRKDTALTAATIRQQLRGRLPEHMVPAHFVFMESLPLTQNGKVNRHALPKPQPSLTDLRVAPRTTLEQALVEAWQQALSLERISLDDNFFDVGGHSLLVARVRFVLGEQLKRDISLMDFFTYPTIRSLARRLEQTEEKPISISDSQERAARQKASLRMRRQRILQREQQQEAVND